MVLPLTHYGNPVLRRKGEPVKKIDATLRTLVENMLETMHQSKGVGLAAQQVGQALQLAVIDIGPPDPDRPSSMTIDGKAVQPQDYMPLVLINATVEGTKAKESGEEGCLSFPGLRLPVPRSRRVKVTTQKLDGGTLTFEAGGLLAVAVQHEHDHLQGKLFIDYLSPQERQLIKADLEAIERNQPARAA